MRVISQDGTLDFPYELSTIRVYNEIISMGMCKDDSCRSIIARYSTEAKAIKAMEMLREAFFENKHEETYREGIYYYSPCFQFPQDDEIEA